MNIAKYSIQKWLSLFRAAQYVSEKLGHPYSEPDLLEIALAGRIPLALNIPPGMRDKQGRALKDGPWDLLIRGQRGKPGKQQVMHQLDNSVSVNRIDGAWVMRKSAGSRAARQLQPQTEISSGEFSFPSAFPKGAALGVRTMALNAFAKKQKGQTPSKAAEQLDPRERQTHLKLIAGLALHGGFTEFTGPAFAQVTDLLGGKHGVSAKAATEKINQLYDEAEEKGWERRLPRRARVKKKTKSGQR
jgi:hypothetical protein